jgi:hypothetical protein
MASTLSNAAGDFLAACIHSLLELDILLVLHNEGDRWWNADQVAAEMRIAIPLAASALESLASHNLLDVRIGVSLAYRYSPLDGAVRALTAEIARHHYAARELIGAQRRTRLAAERFADAFRLRKKDG